MRELDEFPSFHGRLTWRPLADGRAWVLTDVLRYLSSRGLVVRVPAGFVTDFASVPRPLWWWIPAWGRHGFAAVLHDWLYYCQVTSRRMADDLFREAMAELGVGRAKRTLMWLAVRGPGWFAWAANRRRTERLGDGWKMVDLEGDRFELTEAAGRRVR